MAKQTEKEKAPKQAKKGTPPKATAAAKPEKKPKAAEKTLQGSRDASTGYRTETKKYAVFGVYRAGGTMGEALKTALKFLGTHDAAAEKSTKGSVRAWYREFDRKKFAQKGRKGAADRS